MNEIQNIQYQMLIELDDVCRRHGLIYYLAYGTCLGAVRHRGFIPWDHDIDVLMPFQDSVELEKYQDEFSNQFFISSRRTDKDNKTVKSLLENKEIKCRLIKNGNVIDNNVRIGLDIYPFYNCPESRLGLLLNIWRSHIQKMLVGGVPENHGRLVKVIAKVVLFFYSGRRRERKVEKIEHQLCYSGPSTEIADYYGMDISACSAITYKKDWFGKPKELLFENKTFYGPSNPDKYLTKRYGDYMTPVSKKEIENEARLEIID